MKEVSPLFPPYTKTKIAHTLKEKQFFDLLLLRFQYKVYRLPFKLSRHLSFFYRSHYPTNTSFKYWTTESANLNGIFAIAYLSKYFSNSIGYKVEINTAGLFIV